MLMTERDVSDEKQKERVKNEFISVVSHELRTPMTIIRGYATLLVDGKLGALNTKQAEYMTRINVETSRLLDLANDMLDLQKFEAGKADLHTEKMDVKDAVLELINEFEPLFTKKGLYLKLENSSQNPHSMVDKRYLNRAFINILQNAFKFTEKGGVTIFMLNPDEKHIVIAFKDTGVGIAQDAIPHLFSKFYQASNVLNRKQDGSGLGLSIVKKIIEAHKGLIWVESTENEGSTFYIALPI
jgi:signal transduction histidine kinase